ncbi:hypothetical protein AX14_008312, partial [Amanita brunnescens Koide BX004]
MPPMKLSLGPPLNTRASNKTTHPGNIVKPNPRRSHAEVEAERQEKARKEKEKVDAQKRALQAIADTEDDLCIEDKNRERARTQAASVKAANGIKTAKTNNAWQETAPNINRTTGNSI